MENTLSTIESAITSVQETMETAEQTISAFKNFLPSTEELANLVPADVEPLSMLKFIGIFAAAAIVTGLLGRVILGQRSNLNHALSSAMGIFFILAVSTYVYVFDPRNLAQYLSPLPYVAFSGDYLVLFSFTGNGFAAICDELLSMIILAFLVNLLDSFLPKGNNIISWYLMRFITICLCMILHVLVRWAFETYLPEVLVKYAPTVLLGILVFMFLSGALNLILGLFLATMNPFIGAMYTFFFSTVVGKQVSKAVFCSSIIIGVFWLMDYFGYTVIAISAAALLTYIPLAVVLLLLWYLIGHLL